MSFIVKRDGEYVAFRAGVRAKLHRLTPEETRALAQSLYDAIPPEKDDDGNPLCPKCGCAAEFEPVGEGGFWFCPQTECDGYLQTVAEDDDDEEVEV